MHPGQQHKTCPNKKGPSTRDCHADLSVSESSNVLDHLDENKILTDCQHGFRARRNFVTRLLTLAQVLVEGLDMKHQHDLMILDFSKAFNCVPHERLLRNLDHYGIRESTHNWIKVFITDRSHHVLV